MAIFDAELLRRFRYLSLAARRSAARSLVAPTQRRRPGGGAESGGLRDYVPGDDYRSIDWTRCARHDELLSRTFDAAVDLHVYVLLDCSPSMGQGSPAKFRLARRIVAALGYAAVTNLDRLSVAALSDRVVADLPPIRQPARLPGLFRFLEQLSLSGAQTDLKQTAESFVRRYQRHGPVVVISDLYDRRGFRHALDVLRHRGYEPRVVQIHDPLEAEPEFLGDVELFDVEAETARRVTVSERAVRRYRELFARFRRSVRDYCSRHAIDCLQIASDAPENDVLSKVLGCSSP